MDTGKEVDGPCTNCFWEIACEMPGLEKCRHTDHHFSRRTSAEEEDERAKNLARIWRESPY